MAGKAKANKMELMRENERLVRENQQLRIFVQTLRARATTPAPQAYMSGRWHRRSGDVYGIVVQGDGVADADGPTGNLRSPE